jgi:hypothetical protein
MAGYIVEPRYYHQDLTVPPFTPIATPVTLDAPTPNIELISVNVRVPAGHAGNTGFQIVFSEQAIIPYGIPSEWFILDNDEMILQAGYNTDNTLMFVAYNLDVYPHTFHLDWVAQDIASSSAGAVVAFAPFAAPQPAPLALVASPQLIAPAVA